MRKVSLFILADFMITSCMIEEALLPYDYNISNQGNGTVGFIVTVTPFTRSGASDRSEETLDSFGLFSFNSGDSQWDSCGGACGFMDNVHVQCDGGRGVISSACALLPSEGMNSFFAYAPFVEDADWTDGIGYVVDEDIDSQTDLVYASAFDVCASASEVGLVFRHSLAYICFEMRAQPDESGHTVRLKSVRVGGTSQGQNFYRRANFDLASGGVWRNRSHEDGNPLIFTLDETHFNHNASALPADYALICDEGSFIMVIPQDFRSSGLPVEVSFSIMDGDAVLLDDCLRSIVYPDFRQGKTCSFRFDLTPVPIEYAPAVELWEEMEACLSID